MSFKKCILLGLISTWAVSPAFAMDARKEVLGGVSIAENAPAGVALDSADSFVNPAYIVDYNILLGIEGTSAANDFYTGFVFIELAKIGLPGSLGIQVARNFGLLKEGALSDAPRNINNLNAEILATSPTMNVNATIDGNSLTDLNDVESFGVIYGLPLGEVAKAGLAFNYIGNGVEGKEAVGLPLSADISKSLSDIEARLGGEYQLWDMFTIALDLGMGLPAYDFTYSSSTLSQEASFSSLNIDANFRLAYALNQNFDIIGLAGYANFGGKVDIDPDTLTADDAATLTMTRNDVYIALGGLWQDETGLAGLALGFVNQAYQDEQKYETAGFDAKNNPASLYFPTLQFVVEKNMATWLCLRASMFYETKKTSADREVGGISYDSKSKAVSTVSTALGTTINVDDFIIEGVISKLLLFDGPNVIGGRTPSLNTSVSVGYKF